MRFSHEATSSERVDQRNFAMSFGLPDFAPTRTGRSPESSRHCFLDEARRSGFNGSPDVVAAGRGRKSACGRDSLLCRRGCTKSRGAHLGVRRARQESMSVPNAALHDFSTRRSQRSHGRKFGLTECGNRV